MATTQTQTIRIAAEDWDDDEDDDSFIDKIKKWCFKCYSRFQEKRRADARARRARLAEKMDKHSKPRPGKPAAKDAQSKKLEAAGLVPMEAGGLSGGSGGEEEEPWTSYRESKRKKVVEKLTWKRRIFGDPDKLTKNFAFWDPNYPIYDYQNPVLDKKVFWIGIWDK